MLLISFFISSFYACTTVKNLSLSGENYLISGLFSVVCWFPKVHMYRYLYFIKFYNSSKNTFLKPLYGNYSTGVLYYISIQTSTFWRKLRVATMSYVIYSILICHMLYLCSTFLIIKLQSKQSMYLMDMVRSIKNP